MRRLVFIGFTILSLAACGRSIELPQGLQTVTGTVERVPLSLDRQGTHVLKQDGVEVYFLESAQVILSAFEGKDVTLEGTLRPNSDPQALPVLVVATVAGGEEEELVPVSFPALRLSLRVPASWRQRDLADKELFTDAATGRAVLILFSHSADATPFAEPPAAWVPSPSVRITPFLVGSRRATRLSDAADCSEWLLIDRGEDVPKEKRVLTLNFIPAGCPQDPRALEAIGRIVRSVKIQEEAGRAASSVAAGSASSGDGAGGFEGKPCGGTAGILCPPGYFCAVTDTASDVGKCRRM